MAIVDTINSMKQHIEDAYGIVEEKGGTIPQNKNLENMANSIGSITGGGGKPTPDYIEDGLIAWWEGEDNVNENKQWMSRIGDAYIHQISANFGDNNETNNFSIIKSPDSYKNNLLYVLATNIELDVEGYTIEIVGKVYNNFNYASGNNTTGSCLLTYNRSLSPCIQVYNASNGMFLPLNETSWSHSSVLKQYINLFNKRCTFVIHNSKTPGRGVSGSCQIDYSLNGNDWSSTPQVGMTSSNYSQTNNLCPIMCYYSSTSQTKKYSGCGEINSIRVYNRKLTHEELQHNYQIDKLRYPDINDYEG